MDVTYQQLIETVLADLPEYSERYPKIKTAADAVKDLLYWLLAIEWEHQDQEKKENYA